MNEKEVAELRRRYKPDRNAITRVRGCYVNEKGEILSRFEQPMSMLTQDESERLLALMRKTLSGTLGKNLLDIEFDTAQVAYGEEHKLLMTLRNSRLEDEEALFDIGWDDYLDRGGVCAVEWSENVADAMENAIFVTIEKTGEGTRRITVEGGGNLADLSL